MYELLLLVGGLGYLAMVLMGMMHFGGHHGAHGGGHGGHAFDSHHGGHAFDVHHGAHGGLDHHGGGHALPGGEHGHGGAASEEQANLPVAHTAIAPAPASATTKLLGFLPSPMDLFAFAAGAGATGIFLRGVLAPVLTVWASVAGALVFNYLVVKPVFGLVGRFVSTPSEGLEGQVAHVGEAVVRFDAEGRGLVRLTLDGQIVQLLARLDQDEAERGVEVHQGDRLLVVEVDAKRNSCRVTRELAD